jgi:hypothetical protein
VVEGVAISQLAKKSPHVRSPAAKKSPFFSQIQGQQGPITAAESPPPISLTGKQSSPQQLSETRPHKGKESKVQKVLMDNGEQKSSFFFFRSRDSRSLAGIEDSDGPPSDERLHDALGARREESRTRAFDCPARFVMKG